MQCLRNGTDNCGDVADRFAPLVLLLREAHASQRLLLIHWSDPFVLDEFLQPPRNGNVDWRAPQWLSIILEDETTYPGRKALDLQQLKDLREDKSTTLVRAQLKFSQQLIDDYDKARALGDEEYRDVYHDVWRILFTPSPPIRAFVEELMNKWRLTPGEYVVANDDDQLMVSDQSTPRRILDCASMLRPGGPILYLANTTTDSMVDYGKSKGTRIVTWMRSTQSLSLKIHNKASAVPKDMYNVFINLYLQGLSRCTTSANRKFGSLTSMIGYDSTCLRSLPPSTTTMEGFCKWMEPEKRANDPGDFKVPLFPPAVVDEISEDKRARKLTNFSSQPLPVWMTDYFEWHRETMRNLTKFNWNQSKYLVVVCDKRIKACGGLSDRLKPIPYAMLLASRHRRLLFIDWERPRPLQEFLEPPPGGLQWVLPSWLRPLLRSQKSTICLSGVKCGRALYTNTDKTLLKVKLQISDGGEELYEQQPDSLSTYADVVHGLFRVMFKPVHRLQIKIDQKMEEFGLSPGGYAAVHLRNLFGRRESRPRNETIALVVDGINCASALLPGSNVYFASDDHAAVKVARQYGRQRQLPIGSWEHEQKPIHFDKDADWANRNASDYDPTFVDFYLLGQARCVAFSNGGYGSFGSLLSYDPTCKVRYFRGEHMIRSCKWTDAKGNKIELEPPDMSGMEKTFS